MARDYVVGVDVGTGSVRAGVFDLHGRMRGHASREISVWKPAERVVEQSSDEIWRAACACVRDAVRLASVPSEDVAGIAFDATCSLVALGPRDEPVTVSPTGQDDHNVVVWMDHRALEQAARITATKHAALRSVGGVMSPEMEPPKLLWLKEHSPDTWERASRFLDLADFMGYRATGVDVRSLCTTVCKWAYDGERGRWNGEFFARVGLKNLPAEKSIGDAVLPMGTPIGPLTATAASEMGLAPDTSVAVGIIDAHAGGIGVIGIGFRRRPLPSQLEQVLALIGGTSSCHMAVSVKPRFIRGIWGPYPSAMIPGMWLTEGGQSATGSLLEFIIRSTSSYGTITAAAERKGQSVYDYLNARVAAIKEREGKGPEIVKDLHVLPYFLGNRSPNADPTARGVISGLTIDESEDSAARLYYATIQSIAYGTRHIIEVMNRHGYHIKRIHACGGGTKNPVWLQEHADISGCEVVLPKEPEAVLLGTAMLAAVGAQKFPSIMDAAMAMSAEGRRYLPDRRTAAFHRAKYGVFRSMYRDFKKYQRILGDGA
jgi:FGGY-family pentulose kinase